MSAEWLPWAAYGVGYFVWLGYAINRFCDDPKYDDGSVCVQFALAFVWPVCVAVYLPYRIFHWIGVSKTPRAWD